MRLQGKTALISGAAHGIGYATARRFASEGAAVVIADIDEKRGDRATRQIEDEGGRARFVAVDITDHAQVDALIDLTLRELGSLDVLHNNAYVLGAGRAGELSVEDWQRTIDVCLTAYWYCTKAALGPMVAQGKG